MGQKIIRYGALAVMLVLVLHIIRGNRAAKTEGDVTIEMNGQISRPEGAGDTSSMLLIVEYIAVAAIGGVLAVTWLIPMLGDRMSEAVLGSNDEVTQDDAAKATSKAALGDFEGAVEDFKQIAAQEPQNRLPIAEMSRIYAEKLHDPASARAVVEAALARGGWKPDDEAYFHFRLAALHAAAKEWAQARERLGVVETQFAGTPHAAAAHHKKRELDEQEFIASRPHGQPGHS